MHPIRYNQISARVCTKQHQSPKKTLEHTKKDVKEEASEARERNKLQEGVQVKVTNHLQAKAKHFMSSSSFTATILL